MSIKFPMDSRTSTTDLIHKAPWVFNCSFSNPGQILIRARTNLLCCSVHPPYCLSKCLITSLTSHANNPSIKTGFNLDFFWYVFSVVLESGQFRLGRCPYCVIRYVPRAFLWHPSFFKKHLDM